MRLSNLILWICIAITACKPVERKPNKFSDPSFLTIAKYQDIRNSSGLIPFLKAKKPSHRKAAAIAFGSVRDTTVKKYLFITLFSDLEADVRKAAAYAIGQLRDSTCSERLIKALGLELDLDVQKSILVAIGKCADQSSINLLSNLNQSDQLLQEGHVIALMHATRINDSLPEHARVCADYLQDLQSSAETMFYAAFALGRMDKEIVKIHCNLISEMADTATNRDLSIALKRICKTASTDVLNPFVEGMFDSFENRPYQMVEKLKKTDFSSTVGLEFLLNQAKSSRFQITRTVAGELFFAQLPRPIIDTSTYNDFILSSLQSGDMALQSHAAIELSKVDMVEMFNRFIPVLIGQLKDLAMPRQTETYLDLVRALERLTGEQITRPENAINHPVNWKEVVQIPKDQRILIKTNKGEIELQLFVEDAPGSVWNFLNSIDKGDYTDKYFHRVVPDFVIQGGCPRGDGWGAPDWAQRSEFSSERPFNRGAVGLASVGNDTEGIQFFITHCATPQLNGRYTVFGEVISGFSVVDDIDVGDKILEVIRLEAGLEFR